MRADLRDLILEAMPATCREIRREVGFTHDWTWKKLEQLRADRLCHVARWDGLAAVYAAGRGRDAERPTDTAKTREAINADSYQRRKHREALRGPFAALFQPKQ